MADSAVKTLFCDMHICHLLLCWHAPPPPKNLPVHVHERPETVMSLSHHTVTCDRPALTGNTMYWLADSSFTSSHCLSLA